jgi:hypothetical protein
MRDPTVNAAAVAEAKRVRDAVEEARRHLARLAIDITSWTDQGANTLNPEQERHHAIAIVELVANNLRDTAPRRRGRPRSALSDGRARKFTPTRAQLSELLYRVIPALERTRPAKKKRGHSTDEWCDRNQLIVETIELVRQKYGFKPTRNPASSNECGCSIVSKALDMLGIKLSKKTIKNIWDTRNKSPK